MRKKNLLACFLIAIISSSCMRSCGTKDSQAIVVDISAPVEGLDPRYTTSAAASRIAKLIYSPLFDIATDSTPEPFLAKSVEAIDEKTFVITLKENLTFHDGSPLTAEDVVYTFKDLGTEDVASPHAEKFDYVKNISAKGDSQIIFELKATHAPFLTDLCALGIVSKKACFGRSQKCRHENVGSGPYKVKDWDTAKEAIHLTPFENWYEGKAKSDLIFRVVRDENTRILELMGKKADISDSDFSPVNIAELKKNPHLEVDQLKGLGYTYLAMNLRDPRAEDVKGSAKYLTRAALSNKKVRQAIARSIDIDEIIKTVLLNTADRASGLMPNGHWAKDKNLLAIAYDPQTAEKLLDEAGFKRGTDNMRFKVTIATTPNRIKQNTAQLFTDFLRKVGIDASLRIKDWGALYQDMKQGNFEMFIANWVPVTDPDLYYFVHHSSNIPDGEKGGGNRHAYKNPEADRLIELGRVTLDKEKRKTIYQQIERIMLEDLPYIPLWNENRVVVFNRDRVKGFISSSTGSMLGLRNAYIADQKQ